MASNKLPENAGTIVAGVVLLIAAAIYVLYKQDMIGEGVAGLALGLGVALASALVVLNVGLESARDGSDRGVAAGFAALTLVGVSALVTMAVSPGAPAAHGTLASAGQTLALPPELSGSVRVLVHGALSGDDADVRFQLGGTEQPLSGHLVRRTATVRGRKGGMSRVSTAQESEFLAGVLAPTSHQLQLVSANGMQGPLEVSVYKSYLSESAAYVLAAAFVVACAFVGVRRNWKDTGVAAAGLAAVFGVAVFANGTPDAAVRPEIGALLLGPFVGGIGGVVVAWILRRFVRPRSAPSRAAL